MRTYVVANTPDEFEHWCATSYKKRHSDDKVRFVGRSFTGMRGVTFDEYDEVYFIGDWANREDLQDVEALIAIASRARSVGPRVYREDKQYRAPVRFAGNSVEASVKRELAALPDEVGRSTRAAAALVLARKIDAESSATATAMCAAQLINLLDRLRDV